MSEATKHVRALVSPLEANRAGRHHAPRPDLGPPRLLWLPFDFASGASVLDPANRWFDVRPASRSTPIAGPPPVGPKDEMVPCQEAGAVYLPFWSFAGAEGGRLLVDGQDGRVVWSSLAADRQAAVLRLILLVGLSFCLAGLLLVGPRIVGRALGPAIPGGAWAQPLVLIIAFVPFTLWLRRLFRTTVLPAYFPLLDGILSGRIPRSEPAEVRRFLGGVGVLMLTWALPLGIGVFQEPELGRVLALLVCLAIPIYGFRLASDDRELRPQVGSEHRLWTDDWIQRIGFLQELGPAVIFGVAASELLAECRPLLLPYSTFLGTMEVNAIEGLALTVAVVVAIWRSPLPAQLQSAMITSALIPPLLNPFVGPFFASIAQFLGVVLVQRVVEKRLGAQPSLADSVATGVRIEALALLGSMAGAILGSLLLGSSGWTLGDTLGELFGVGLGATMGSTAVAKLQATVLPTRTLPLPERAPALVSGRLQPSRLMSGRSIVRAIAWSMSLIIILALLQVITDLKNEERRELDRGPRIILPPEPIYYWCPSQGASGGALRLDPITVLAPDLPGCEDPGKWMITRPIRSQLNTSPQDRRVLSHHRGYQVVALEESYRTIDRLVAPLGDFAEVTPETRLYVALASRDRRNGWAKDWLQLGKEGLQPAESYPLDPKAADWHIGAPVGTPRVIGIVVADPSDASQYALRPINFLYDEGVLTMPPTVDEKAWEEFKEKLGGQ